MFSYFFSRVHRDLTRVLQGVVLVRCGVLDPDAGSDWHEQDRLLSVGGAGGGAAVCDGHCCLAALMATARLDE